jgi:type I restriction enzyme S subunit
MAEIPPIDIRPDLWPIVSDILRRHVPEYEVWAFGSRVTGKAKPYSDLDLAVISDEPLSLRITAGLADDFSESDLPWRVDVLDWATTSEAFRKIIEQNKVVLQQTPRGMTSAHPSSAATSPDPPAGTGRSARTPPGSPE